MYADVYQVYPSQEGINCTCTNYINGHKQKVRTSEKMLRGGHLGMELDG